MTFICSALSKEQADKFSALLNEILKRQIDPQQLMQALDDISAKIPTVRGVLLPASDPDPPFREDPFCSPKNGDFKLIVGTIMWLKPTAPSILQIGFSWVDVRQSGSGIYVDAQLFAEDGRIMAKIEDNKFSVNQNNTFDVGGDRSTLIVHDDHDREVLNVRFMNPTTIRIYATFPLSQGMSIMANEAGINGIKTPTHIHMDKDCFVGGRKLIFSPDALSARILP